MADWAGLAGAPPAGLVGLGGRKVQARSAPLLFQEREPQRPEGPGGLEAVLRLVHPPRRWPTFRCSCEPAGEVEIASRSVLGCGLCISAACSFMGHLLGLLIRRGEVTALGKA